MSFSEEDVDAEEEITTDIHPVGMTMIIMIMTEEDNNEITKRKTA
jgi:hypothetical protein